MMIKVKSLKCKIEFYFEDSMNKVNFKQIRININSLAKSNSEDFDSCINDYLVRYRKRNKIFRLYVENIRSYELSNLNYEDYISTINSNIKNERRRLKLLNLKKANN